VVVLRSRRGVSGVVASVFIASLIIMVIIFALGALPSFLKAYMFSKNAITLAWEAGNEAVVIVGYRQFVNGMYYYEVDVTNVGSVSVTVVDIVLIKNVNFTSVYTRTIISPQLPYTIRPGGMGVFYANVNDKDIIGGMVVTSRGSYTFFVKNVVIG